MTYDLKTSDLLENHLLTTSDFVISQLNSSLIRRQMLLDITTIDIGLATKINAHQNYLKSSAAFFLTKSSKDFIKVTAQAANICSFVTLFIEHQASNIKISFQNIDARNESSGDAQIVSSEVGDLVHEITTLNKICKAELVKINRYADDYTKNLTSIITLMDANAQNLSVQIDTLTKDAIKCINDIVKGSTDVGNSVSNIGIGVLTTIAGGLKPPPKPDETTDKPTTDTDKPTTADKTKAKEEEKPITVPNVSFATEAIQLASSGTATMSDAAATLKRINTDLAKAYNALAKYNTLISIAKATQAQNQMFIDAFESCNTDLISLLTTWTTVKDAFEALGEDILNVQSDKQAQDLEKVVKNAKSEWKTLSAELSRIKEQYINMQTS